MPPTEGTLDSLRRELQKIESDLSSGATREKDLLEDMDATQRRIAILEHAIREEHGIGQRLQDSLHVVETDMALREQELASLTVDISRIEQERQLLAATAARSMLTRKRLTGWATLEFLLDAHSWRDLLLRRSVVIRLESASRAALETLTSLYDDLKAKENESSRSMQTLHARRDELAVRQSDVQELYSSIRGDLRQLSQSKRVLQKNLNHVRRDREFLTERREEIAESRRQIENIVSAVARGEPLAGVPLSMLKGSLPWPVNGRVVERFGMVRNRDLATVTDNPGIEVDASSEDHVTSVAEGKVSSVTWLRGYGNVCIVEHPGAFYTVYAKLGQVDVAAGDEIAANQLIGYPGFDPISESYRVHFEIWSGKNKKNPLEWLKNR
ncbi:MAG: peptidoglycan DD-metalloendopeptidase family protein [bacterium]|nr:peptidoglycan DD-metalloendopeptidase family protein [bacterium]